MYAAFELLAKLVRIECGMILICDLRLFLQATRSVRGRVSYDHIDQAQATRSVRIQYTRTVFSYPPIDFKIDALDIVVVLSIVRRGLAMMIESE
tara:strand:- start:111 stop:392 length:282 start_codon:yes stop_codon:yes gene_type:complete